MEFDIEDPLLLHRYISDRAELIKKYFDLELEFMVVRGYSEQKNLVEFRSIAISKIGEYTSDRVYPLVPFLAITYVDRFLSKYLNPPDVLRGQDLQQNLNLFVFCCVSIAYKVRCSDFSFVELLNKHRVAEVRAVLLMELQILEGLQWKVRPVTAITFMHFFNPLLKTKDDQQFLPLDIISHILVTIQKDVRFTEFRPSTLAASTILVTINKLHHELYPEFSQKILRSGFVEQTEVEECFDELKKHALPNHLLNRENCSTLVEITTEITEEEDRERIASGFGDSRVDPVPGSEKEVTCIPIRHILSCFGPLIMKCFGLQNFNRDSN